MLPAVTRSVSATNSALPWVRSARSPSSVMEGASYDLWMSMAGNVPLLLVVGQYFLIRLPGGHLVRDVRLEAERELSKTVAAA